MAKLHTNDPLAAARKAAAEAHEQRMLDDFRVVMEWRDFLAAEKEAHEAVMRGELERDKWAAMWAECPTVPTSTQFENARKVAQRAGTD